MVTAETMNPSDAFDSYVADMKPAILNSPFNARQIANSTLVIEWRSFV
jgi:hypothetical protein